MKKKKKSFRIINKQKKNTFLRLVDHIYIYYIYKSHALYYDATKCTRGFEMQM